MAQANPKHSHATSLEAKFWRQWLILSAVWIVIAVGYLTANWQEIYPKRPYYLLVPGETGETLNTWFTTDKGASVHALKRQLQMPDAEEVQVFENILLVPKGAGEATREGLIEKARAMRLTLDERFARTVTYRFVPMLLLFVLGPPFLVLLLGRLAKWVLLRWAGGS